MTLDGRPQSNTSKQTQDMAAKTSTTTVAAAAASPAKTTTTATAAVASIVSSGGSKSLRGLNKPKCIKCGNVARSRCPYQSCKNCCAKAENPCHIHVLKGSSSLPDKPPSSSPLFDQQLSDMSHSGSSNRIRQLSNNFAQFNNLNTSIRSRKPLTRKDAQVINEWRFLKLKEFKEGNIEAETEAFDRYLQNVNLLEEVLLVSSAPNEHLQDEKSSELKSSSAGEEDVNMVQNLKLRLRSNPVRIENFRKRIRHIVDQGLKKLGKLESIDNTVELSDTEGLGKMAKKIKSGQNERIVALTDLCDKLNKARSDEDVKECQEAASQIFGRNTTVCQTEPDHVVMPGESNLKSDNSSEQKLNYLPPKWLSTTTIDQESVSRLDAQFSSLEDIEDL